MRKKVKRKLFFGNQYEVPIIEKFLEREAAAGWMFVRCSGIFYVFEACEPKKVKFQIEYFNKASIFDTNPEQATRDYIEYCEAGGWRHIFSGGKIQIFCSEEENPVPIQTDQQLKLSQLSKATLSINWAVWFLLPIVWGLNIILQLYIYLIGPNAALSFSRVIAERAQIGLVLFYVLFIILEIISLSRFIIFYLKNKRRVKDGYVIQYYSARNKRVFDGFYIGYLIILLFFLIWGMIDSLSMFCFVVTGIVCMIGLVWAISRLTSAKWANRKTNIAIYSSLVVLTILSIMGVSIKLLIIDQENKLVLDNVTYYYSSDEIGVTLEQFGVDKPEEFLYEDTYSDGSKSFLGVREEYSDYYYCDSDNAESVGYCITIFSSKFDAVTKKYESFLENLEDGMQVYKWNEYYVILDSNLDEEVNAKIILYYEQQYK